MPALKSDTPSKKLFYNMGEVSRMLELTPSLLRFWENEFDCLKKVVKNGKGDRKYTEQNIEDIKHIITLVKVKGYTLHGANQYLKTYIKTDNP